MKLELGIELITKISVFRKKEIVGVKIIEKTSDCRKKSYFYSLKGK